MLDPPEPKSIPPKNTDRRRSVRICCTGFAEGISTAPCRLFRGEIRNISDSGCFISTVASVVLNPGTLVELKFWFAGAAYNALARVVETLPSSGFRMRFVATELTFSDHIRRILSARSEPPRSG